jgi:hypothetical protein
MLKELTETKPSETLRGLPRGCDTRCHTPGSIMFISRNMRIIGGLIFKV